MGIPVLLCVFTGTVDLANWLVLLLTICPEGGSAVPLAKTTDLDVIGWFAKGTFAEFCWEPATIADFWGFIPFIKLF